MNTSVGNAYTLLRAKGLERTTLEHVECGYVTRKNNYGHTFAGQDFRIFLCQ